MERDKEVLTLLFTQMAETEGWKCVTVYMENKISSLKERLTTVAPDDIKKIAEYQGTIKGYKELLSYVNNYLIVK